MRAFGAPSVTQLENERARVTNARQTLPLLIQEVKDFKCELHHQETCLSDALSKVTRLIEKVDTACDAAFPSVFSTGRLLLDGLLIDGGTKKREYGKGGWKNGVRSVALFEPELCAGSVEDQNTFVSRLEALRAWRFAVLLSVPLLARVSRDAVDRRWQQADLGGFLQRTHISKVMRALVAELLPGILGKIMMNQFRQFSIFLCLLPSALFFRPCPALGISKVSRPSKYNVSQKCNFSLNTFSPVSGTKFFFLGKGHDSQKQERAPLREEKKCRPFRITRDLCRTLYLEEWCIFEIRIISF